MLSFCWLEMVRFFFPKFLEFEETIVEVCNPGFSKELSEIAGLKCFAFIFPVPYQDVNEQRFFSYVSVSDLK